MKKLLLSFLPVFALATGLLNFSCSSKNENAGEPEVPSTEGNILIAYFSFPETDGVDAESGASRVIVNEILYGSTQYIAEIIREATGGELFRIETEQQYPGSHEQLIEQASREKDERARPEIKTKIENPAEYDIIFIGYPNWWGDLPMPLYTFLEEYDFSGKTIIPFNTHGGSGLSSTVSAIAGIQKDATVVQGFTVSRNSVGGARDNVLNWLKEIGFEIKQ
jgi:flavodoxin